MKELLKKSFPAAIKSVKDWKYSIPGAFKNFDKTEAISLFCDPRGGSTWLAETLNTLLATFIIDEPSHQKNSKEIQKLINYWKSQLSCKTKYDLFKVLEYFEVDYYGDK